MLLNDKINIKISKKNINHLKEKGYCCVCGDVIEIFTKDLSLGSHIKVNVKCDICGKEKILIFQKYIKNINNGGFYACSSKCAQSKVKNTNFIKFGYEYYTQSNDYKEKSKNTCLKKYGTKYHLSSNIIKNKIKETNLKNYGVENPFQSDMIKTKIKETNLKKYGVENPSYSNVVKDLISKRNKDVWMDKLIKDFHIKKVVDDFYYIECDKGHDFKINRKLLSNRKLIKTTICTICNPINSAKSGYEVQLYDFIENNYNGKIKRNERKLLNNKYELDIYIPELKIAFEFNGLYWHNELNKPNNYHLKKTELCEKNEIQLIHIYSDDWLYKQDIIKSMILNKLNKTSNKIYARKTEIKEINDNKSIRDFLNKNHLQGFIGGSVKLGLFFDDELISLMTFGKRRVAMGKRNKEGEYELLRFCSKLNINVIGGANKLFKYFIRNYEFKKIITYADRSWSRGNLYKQLGFNFESKTRPNYSYIIDGVKCHRFSYRKDILIKEGYNMNKTEHQIMLNRKIYRIYNSGNLKFNLLKIIF